MPEIVLPFPMRVNKQRELVFTQGMTQLRLFVVTAVTLAQMRVLSVDVM